MDQYQYDPNTGRMTKWTFQVGSTPQAETGKLTWNANGTLNQMAIVDGFNSLGTETCNYNPSNATGTGYDDLGRLVGVDCGSGGWGQTFSYDQYDNLTKAVISGRTGVAWNGVYDPNTNHYTLTGTSYDLSGNVTDDSFNDYTWDPFNKLLSVNSTACGTNGQCSTYDAFGRMVEFSSNSTFTENWFTQAGRAVMSGTTLKQAYWNTPGGGTFQEVGVAGQKDYMHKDWLGNARLQSIITGQTVIADTPYAPYGETYHPSINGSGPDRMFTGDLTQLDPEVLYDTPNREFASSNQGRWLSPDPAGTGWNQYAYATNPLSFVDPSGLFIAGRWLSLYNASGQDFSRCTQDGIDQSCATVYFLLQGGGAVHCPTNDCMNVTVQANGEIYQKQYSNPDVFQCNGNSSNWDCYPTHWVSTYLGNAGDRLPSSVLCVYIGGGCDSPLTTTGQAVAQRLSNTNKQLPAAIAMFEGGSLLLGSGPVAAIVTAKQLIVTALIGGLLGELYDYVIGGDPPPEHNPNYPSEPGCTPCDPEPAPIIY